MDFVAALLANTRTFRQRRHALGYRSSGREEICGNYINFAVAELMVMTTT
jgi:hypothetical protein